MLLFVLPKWLLPDTERLTEHLGEAAVSIALTVAGAWLVQRVGFLVIRRSERWMIRASQGSEHAIQRARTLGQISRHTITSLVAGAALLHSLDVLGWDVKPLLVGASILGAALGFGAQYLVRDIIAGAFILIEDQFTIGDRIEVNGQIGTVEAITLRMTQLRDFTGRILFVPNGEMKVIVNHSRGWNLAIVDVPIATDQDLAGALVVAAKAAEELSAIGWLREKLYEPLQLVGLDRIGHEGAVLRLAGKAHADGGAFLVAREGRSLLMQRLREAGIRTGNLPDLNLKPRETPGA
jgi:small conductance mechanosensitive channel